MARVETACITDAVFATHGGKLAADPVESVLVLSVHTRLVVDFLRELHLAGDVVLFDQGGRAGHGQRQGASQRRTQESAAREPEARVVERRAGRRSRHGAHRVLRDRR